MIKKKKFNNIKITLKPYRRFWWTSKLSATQKWSVGFGWNHIIRVWMFKQGLPSRCVHSNIILHQMDNENYDTKLTTIDNIYIFILLNY